MGCPISISPLTRADIAAVVEIEKQGQLEPWTEQSFIEEFDRLHSYLLAARLAGTRSRGPECGRKGAGPGALPGSPSGTIAGYICFWCVADELQILNIAVHKDFRRRAVGRALLEHAIRIGYEKKARIAVLEVRKSNAAARRLYETMGFRVVGERPDYYGVQKEPALLMELAMGDHGCVAVS